MPNPLLIAARISPYRRAPLNAPHAVDDTGLDLPSGSTASFNILANDQRVDDASLTPVGGPTAPITAASIVNDRLQVTAGTVASPTPWSQAYQVQTVFGISTAVASGTVQPTLSSASIVYQWELNDVSLSAQIPATGGIQGSVEPTGGLVAFGQPTIPTGGTGGVAVNGQGYLTIDDPGISGTPGVFQQQAWGVSIYAQIGALTGAPTTNGQIVQKDRPGVPGGWALEYRLSTGGGVNRLDPYVKNDGAIARRFSTSNGIADLALNDAFLVTLTFNPTPVSGPKCSVYLWRSGETATKNTLLTPTGAVDETSMSQGMLDNFQHINLGAYSESSGLMTGALQRLIIWAGAPTKTQLDLLPAPNDITITYPTALPAPVAGAFTGRDITVGQTSISLDVRQPPSLNADTGGVTVAVGTVTGPVTAAVNPTTQLVTITKTTQTGGYSVAYTLTNSAGQQSSNAISGTVVATSTTVAFNFRTSRPSDNHTGFTNGLVYNPSDPMSESVTDPMSDIDMFRLTGPRNSTVFRLGNINTGLVFPKKLVTENLPDTNKVWNADGSLVMIDKTGGTENDPSNAAYAILLDVYATRGASKRWQVLRAGTSNAFGEGANKWTGGWWFWSATDPYLAYGLANNGSMWRWWPIGTPNGSRTQGETEQLHGALTGFSEFTSHGARPPKTNASNGRYCTVGCFQNSSGLPGGFRIDLQSGNGTHTNFIPSSDLDTSPIDDGNRGLCSISTNGQYAWFTGRIVSSGGGTSLTFFDVVTGNQVGNRTPTSYGHMDFLEMNNKQYLSSGTTNGDGVVLWDVVASTKRTVFDIYTGSHHTSARNVLDTFERHGQMSGATGTGTQGVRYLTYSHYGSPHGIWAISIAPGNLNVYRFIGNHRSAKTENLNEAHWTVSPPGNQWIGNSNMKDANAGFDSGLISTYCFEIEMEKWQNPNNDGHWP